MSLVKNPPWWEPLRWWGTARCLGPISSPSVAALPTFVQHPEHCHGHISCLQQLHGIWEIKIKLGKSYWVLSGQMLGKDWWVCREAAERWERVSQSLEQWFWVVSGWLEKRVRSWMKYVRPESCFLKHFVIIAFLHPSSGIIVFWYLLRNRH